MTFSDMTIQDFTAALASKAPVPGGGGASALVGAVGMALGHMVGSLTVGKKKYAAVEADIISLMERAAALQTRLLALIQQDAEAFEPLSLAYGLPKDTPEQQAYKARVMAEALDTACSAPMDIMKACCEAIELQRDFAEKGSVLALSDAGVGVAFCKAALHGASLNVFINTKAMADRGKAEALNRACDEMLTTFGAMADEVFGAVTERLR